MSRYSAITLVMDQDIEDYDTQLEIFLRSWLLEVSRDLMHLDLSTMQNLGLSSPLYW